MKRDCRLGDDGDNNNYYEDVHDYLDLLMKNRNKQELKSRINRRKDKRRGKE